MRRTTRKKMIKGAPSLDSFENFATRTGYGTANLSTGGGYSFTPTSRDRVQLENAYRSSWIVGQVVDAYAEDMTREGVDFLGDDIADVQEELHRACARLQLWSGICDTIKWARLYGGCIAVMMIDGQKTDQPLRLESIGKESLRGLLVLDRWMVQPNFSKLVNIPGPEFGKPEFYDTVADSSYGVPAMKIHYSRCIRIEGIDLPYWQRIAENGWGNSVVERLYDRLLAFDSTTQGAAQLVYKAHLRTYKVKGLREIIAIGGKAFEGLTKQIDMIRLYQSNEGMTLMDAEDEFEAHQYTFSGLDNVLLQFGQQIAGATGIPLVRLFGQSPAGLNSTGESDIRTYYDNVKQTQERRLRFGLTRLFGVLYRSVTGNEPPENFDFKFRPLWQMSDKEKSEIANTTSQAVSTASNAGIIDRATALKELRNCAQVSGVFQSITDEDIKAAEEEPPPMIGEMVGMGKEIDPKKTADKGFVESEHPRDPDGKFTEGGSGGNSHAIKASPVGNVAAFAKLSKAKIIKNGLKPGHSVVEVPAGVKESVYAPILEHVEELAERAKGTEYATAAGYMRRSVELGFEERKYSVSVHFDEKNGIIGAMSMHSLPDSVRIETLGGFGGGTGCLLSAIRASKKAGKGGAITLTPVRDPKTVEWYARCGFEEKKNSPYGEFWLSPEAATALEKRYGSK